MTKSEKIEPIIDYITNKDGIPVMPITLEECVQDRENVHLSDKLSELKENSTHLERRIKNLEDASKGVLYTEQIDSSEAYTKSVPSGALSWGSLDKLGGKSIVIDGQLIDANVSEIESKSQYADVISTIPTADIISKYFPQGMKSAGNIYDEIDLIRGKAIKRVESVDLSSLSFRYYENYNMWISSDIISDIQPPQSTRDIVNILSKYISTSQANIGNTGYLDGNIACTSGKQIYITNGSTTNNPSGLCNYELATPIETDMDEADIEALKYLEVEGNGTITFKNIDNLNIPIPSTETYLVKVGGTN